MNYLIVLDPLDSLNTKHDSSIGMMLAIQKQNNPLWVCDTSSLFINSGHAYAHAAQITVNCQLAPWHQYQQHDTVNLADFDIILMRKDPPFDMNYIFATYILDIAANNGVLVANNPKSLRDFNEKLILNYFPELTTEYIVSSHIDTLLEFIATHQDTVIKPLDSMGGDSVFRLKSQDNNRQRLLDITLKGTRHVMLMPYIPEVTVGDKRLILLNGKTCPYALLRTPPEGQLQANLAAGGRGSVVPLTDRDYTICNTIAPFCLQHGLYIVGIDVIGDSVTEINITSPTCLREIEDHTGDRLCEEFIDGLSEQI